MRNNNLKIGIDYSLTKKTILGVVISGFYNPKTSVAIMSATSKSCFEDRFYRPGEQFFEGNLEK